MISIDALIFDLDGTLIDSKRDIALSVQAVQKKLGVPLSDENTIGSFIGDGVVKLMQRALRLNFREDAEPTRRVLDAVELFKAHYRTHCLDHTNVYPHVRDTLLYFRHKRMAVVTNKPVRISQRILSGLGLMNYFQIVLGGDSTPRRKPHPDSIFQALEFLKVRDVRRAVVIGDSASDIAAGRAAGTWTCGVPSNIGDARKLRQSLPDFTVPNLSETIRLFN
jgi:phosphoglycolate phosphatase